MLLAASVRHRAEQSLDVFNLALSLLHFDGVLSCVLLQLFFVDIGTRKGAHCVVFLPRLCVLSEALKIASCHIKLSARAVFPSAAKSGALPESLDFSGESHLLDSLRLKFLCLELSARLGPVLENVLVDALAVVLFVLELVRVDAVFASNFVNQSELGVVPHLGHLPLLVPYEVVRKCLLRELIARRQLEYLCVKVLFLHGNLQLDLRHFDWLVQDLTGVFGKVNRVELGCLESNLVHVDDLCQIVVLSDSDIVDHIVHLLLDALIGLDFLCSCCVL